MRTYVKRKELKNRITDHIESSICDLYNKDKDIVRKSDLDGRKILSIGQAQKWINMTLKYLRIMGIN